MSPGQTVLLVLVAVRQAGGTPAEADAVWVRLQGRGLPPANVTPSEMAIDFDNLLAAVRMTKEGS